MYHYTSLIPVSGISIMHPQDNPLRSYGNPMTVSIRRLLNFEGNIHVNYHNAQIILIGAENG
jgi:hypothetical protein